METIKESNASFHQTPLKEEHIGEEQTPKKVEANLPKSELLEIKQTLEYEIPKKEERDIFSEATRNKANEFVYNYQEYKDSTTKDNYVKTS